MKKELNNNEILDILKDAHKRAKKRELVSITDKTQLSTEEKFKISLCKYFIQYLNETGLKPIDLHKKTGIEQSRISEILHYKITKFTIDKLLGWLRLLAEHSAKVREHIFLLEAFINVPIMPVKESKQLARNLKKLALSSDGKSYLLP